MAIHPLLGPADTAPDPFVDADPSVIDFPDKKSAVEEVYHQTIDLQPDHAAEVSKLSDKLQQPPEFVDNNLDTAKKAAATPDSTYFSSIEKTYPQTASYLAQPKNMAVAKDDINNLSRTEGLVRGYTNLDRLWRTANASSAQVFADVAKLPATTLDIMATPGNLMLGAAGRPDLEWQSPDWLRENPMARYYEKQMAAWRPPPIEDYQDLIKKGDFGAVGQKVAESLVDFAPALAVSMMSAGAGVTMMTEQATSGALDRNRETGVTPAESGLNAFYHGAFAAALMQTGVIGPFKRWGESLSQVVGPDTAKKIFMGMLGSMGHSGATFGVTMGATSFANDYADYATGVNPQATEGALRRSAEAAIGGTLQGFGLGAMSASMGTAFRAENLRRAEQTRDMYTAMGEGMKDSALRNRLPDAHRAFVDQVTRDGPVESVGIRADKFDTYFQEKNIDPMKIANDLGVGDQLAAAREASDYVNIPLSSWADKMVGTEHYDALKDDIRFHPEDQTVNEARATQDQIIQDMSREADKASKADPAIQKGRDFVRNDVIAQLTAAGRPKDEAKASAELWASRAAVEASRRGITPEQWYKQGNLAVQAGGVPQPVESLEQAQLPPAPTFFSAINKAIAEKAPEKGTAEQMLGIIKNTPGIKQEEMDWTGTEQWLKAQKGPVSKQELLQYVNRHQVQIQEILKGTENKQNALEERRAQLEAIPEDERSLSQVNELSDIMDAGPILGSGSDETKFEKYVLPGGENYRELLMTLPADMGTKPAHRTDYATMFLKPKYGSDYLSKIDTWTAKEREEYLALPGGSMPQGDTFVDRPGAVFTSSHWNEPNVLAHVRFNDRTDTEGKKMLFLEEVQSDWHQRGRQKGYGERDKSPEGLSNEEYLRQQNLVPDAPFKKNWHELAIKRMLRYAVDKGYEKIGWTTGEQQAARYDLSKQVDSVTVWSDGSGKFHYEAKKNGRDLARDDAPVTADKLPDIIGKELAKKAIEKIEAGEPAKFAGLDLKVGGEGMKGFYDKIVPEFLAKYAKKWGAKPDMSEVDTRTKGYEDARFEIPEQIQTDFMNDAKEAARDAGLDDETNPDEYMSFVEGMVQDLSQEYAKKNPIDKPTVASVHSLAITPEMRKAMVMGQPLFQDPTDPRGFIQFTPEKTIVSLVKADASTFMHESAHFWLKDMHDFVRSGKADESYLKDWKTLADFLKIKDDQTKLEPGQQEKFAKAFESYIRDGQAPSEGLRKAFGKFRKWLTRLYQDPRVLGMPISDEVRGVMDRMLASDSEIDFARKQMSLDPGIDIEGLDPKVRNRLDSLRESAREQAVNELTRSQMEELTKENQKKLLDESMKARNAATAEVINSPVQEAMKALGKTLKADPRQSSIDYWSSKMDGAKRAAFDQLAEARGFSSGDELAKKIIDEKPPQVQVQKKVDAHMAQFADMRKTSKIKDEALRAVHESKQTELLAAEAGALRSMISAASYKVAQAKLEADAAKARAKSIIAAKPVSDAGQFMPYFTAERNFALESQKAATAKDWTAAAEAKRKQMLNHALASEALKARAELTKTMNFFERFSSRGQDMKNMQYGFIRQIDTLLADRGLAEPNPEDAQTYLKIAQDMAANKEDASEIAHKTGWMQDATGAWRQESLADTVARIEGDYRNIAMPESVMTLPPKDFKQMTMGQLRDLKQAVKAINSIGRGYENFLDDTLKLDVKTAAGQFREYVEKNVGAKYLSSRDIGSDPGNTKLVQGLNVIRNLPDTIAPSLVNLLSFCDFLDAGNPDGPAKQYIYRPLKRGGDGETLDNRQAVTDMNALHDEHWKKGEFENLKKEKVFIRSRNRSMTRDEILAVALNQGNETNQGRVMNGYKLTSEQLAEIMSNVPKAHMDFAQAIWDHMDKYWPDIVAQQQKVSGETPERVTPKEVVMPYGTYKGGYYPLAYDYTRSNEAYANIEKRNALYKSAGAVYAHTDHGFTKGRVQNYSSPVKLDTGVMFNHLQDVIHDLNLRQPVIDVNRFLRQTDVREAITNAVGLQGLRTIEQHLKWVASDQGQSLTAADRFLRYVRFGATTATLGLRPLQGPLSFSGNVINAMQDMGPVRFANSVRDFLSDKDNNVALVNNLSARMSEREIIRDRDLNDMAGRWRGANSTLQHYTFYFDNKSDLAISYPMWLEMYKRNVGELGQQKAVDMADEAVTRAMGTGLTIDQAMVQRGSESQKIWSWWYSWSGMMFNRAWRAGKFAGLEHDKGNVGAALKITGTAALYGWAYQGAAENFWRELFRNTQNVDEDKRKKRVAERMILQPISYVPIARELAQYALDKAVGGKQAAISLPFQGAIESMINPLAEMAKSELDDKPLSQKFGEDSARVAAIVLKYPQIFNTWAFNFIDYLNNEGDLTMKDLLTRRTKS